MRILDGKRVALERQRELQKKVSALKRRGIFPKLAVILPTEDEAALAYLRAKERLAGEVGIDVERSPLPTGGTEGLLRRIQELDLDQTVSGILVEAPLPSGIDAAAMRNALPLDKDVDGAGYASLGRLAAGHPLFVPATAAAVLALLDGEGIEIAGQRVTVLGRSLVVGRPLALLLLARDATVTVCHSRTRDLGAVVQSSDIVCVAVGRPGFLTAEMVRPGAVVIDIGTNRVAGRLVGDIDFDCVAQIAGAVSPVPGGVGPLTTTILLEQVADAAERVGR